MPSVVFTGVTPNAGNWAAQICSDAGIGICQKFGVHMKMIYSASSPAAIAALYAGSVQYTTALYTAAFPAYLQKPDLMYIASGYDSFPYQLVVAPGIHSVSQIAGHTCGVQISPNIADGLYMQLMIQDATSGAVTYPRDYHMKVDSGMATVSGASAALKSGGISCTVQVPPNDGLLKAQGYPTILRAVTLPSFQKLPFFGVNALHSWVTKNKATNAKFLMGYLASIAWLEDPAHKEQAVRLLARDAQVPISVAEASYEYVTLGGYPREGLLKPYAISSNLALAQKYGGVSKSVTASQLAGMASNAYVKAAYARLPVQVRCENYVKAAVQPDERPDCAKLYSNPGY